MNSFIRIPIAMGHTTYFQLVHNIRMGQILISKGRKLAQTGSSDLIAFIDKLCGVPDSGGT